MRNLLKTIVVLCLFCMPFLLNAQKVIKLGHIDSNEMIKGMPETDSAQAKFQKYYKEMETTLKGMEEDIKNQVIEYKTKKAELTEMQQQIKEDELTDKNERFNRYKANAQNDLQEYQYKLSTPIQAKFKKAVEEVAKENGYTYIFDSGNLLYSESSDDIKPLVKKKLGLK